MFLNTRINQHNASHSLNFNAGILVLSPATSSLAILINSLLPINHHNKLIVKKSLREHLNNHAQKNNQSKKITNKNRSVTIHMTHHHIITNL